MSAAPQKPDAKAKAKPREKARLESMDGTTAAEMPPVPAGLEYLLDILFDIGPVFGNGFGASPISEQELVAWQLNRQVRLTPWECATIRRLSKDYAAMYQDASEFNFPSPYTADDETDPAEKARRVQQQFKDMAAIRRVTVGKG